MVEQKKEAEASLVVLLEHFDECRREDKTNRADAPSHAPCGTEIIGFSPNGPQKANAVWPLASVKLALSPAA